MLNLKNSLLVGASVSAFAMVAGPALAQQGSGNETVIVTGTRVQGMTAADSAAPITVLGTDALTKGTGSTDLRQALGQTVPSFTAQQFGGDTANLTLSASLRGLSPNDTLVLVNGKRRHYTGNLHVDAGGFAAGSSSADLSMIPEAAIDHVEVLLDGAAAQYGTDAIAGVVNIILKKKSSGGTLSATAGDYYNHGGRALGDTNENGNKGESYDLAYNMGLPLFDHGFVNFTIEKQFSNFTQYGGNDPRYFNAAGAAVPQTTVTGIQANNGIPTGVASLSSTGVQIPNNFLPGVIGFPRANSIDGNPQSSLTTAEMNTGYDFSDTFSVYAFGTIAHKFAKSFENDRLPNQVIATAGSDQPCSATNPTGYNTGSSTPNGLTPQCSATVGGGTFALAGSTLPGTPGAGLNAKGVVISEGGGGGTNSISAGNLFSANLVNAVTGAAIPAATGEPALGTATELVLYPNGFRPMEVLKEDDYQYNLGTKFNVLGWDIDANVGYGKDIDNIYTWNSANRALFLDTHTTPTRFYDGSFTASQFTGTIDAVRPFNVGMASPLTVAVGVEAREDLYGISSGDAGSLYKDGPQSFPGFATATAGRHSRKNYAVYVDLAVAPIEALQLDLAGRAEHYTDFGDTQIGKLTARYDFNPQIAIRGTISTGFRAPTLAEEFYDAVNVSPTSATVQLPADSAAAKIIGLSNLKPEVSTSYSVGLVAHPIDDLSATVDLYSITIGNRIVTSASVNAIGGTFTAPVLVNAAIASLGVTLDPTAATQGVTAFLNGLNTVTQGLDATINYPTDFGDYGSVDWTLAGNYNTTGLSKVAPTPAPLAAANPSATFFRPDTLYNYIHSAPVEKIALTANWSLDDWGVTFRETFWGPQHNTVTPNSGGQVIPFNQAGVGLTDLEARYNVTEGLQLALGANNIFNIKPDLTPFAQSPVGPNNSAGQALPGGNGSVIAPPFGTSWNPNGGYYYGRISYNF